MIYFFYNNICIIICLGYFVLKVTFFGFNGYIKSSVIQVYHRIFKAFTRFPLRVYFTLLNVVYSRDAQAHPRGYSTPFRFQYNFLKIYFLGVKASEGLILYTMSTLDWNLI